MYPRIRRSSAAALLCLGLLTFAVGGPTCWPSPTSWNQKTVTFPAYSFPVGEPSYWFDLTEWTRPDRPTTFTVDFTTTKSLDFVNDANGDGTYNPEELDDVRAWAMLQNGHGGGTTSYLPMKLKFISYHKYQATLVGLAPDFATGQGSPAKWKVRVDKRYHGDPDLDFTMEVNCQVTFTPWGQL
ncbi:MAG: hypothetical protein KA354_06265 [Phycisphaerae bacterium]|nr:hypothetical protein [Phycisphaerae bacterium]